MDSANIDSVQLQRVRELESLITKYQKAYYNGESPISDNEFDDLWDELYTLDPDNEIFSVVGRDSSTAFVKREHLMTMGSQHKANDADEFEKWYSNNKDDDLIIEYKMDGASIELQYSKGKLKHAVTRGDGFIGDSITKNALKFKGVLTELSEPFSGSIRGEVVMSHDVFRRKFSDKANCRNAANGLMKRIDGEGCENLNVVVYDIFGVDDCKNKFSLETEKINYLTKLGFEVVPSHYMLNTTPSRLTKIHDFRDITKKVRASYAYDIDGIVIKCNKIDEEDALRERPMKQIAYKFELESALTHIKDIQWSQNGQTFTPVAIIDEVSLCGTRVSRASLANYALYKRLNIHYGDLVKVVKRGEIIPKIMAVVTSNENEKIIPALSVCPSCGKELTVKDGNFLTCTNPDCPGNASHKFSKFVEVNEIKGFGPQMIANVVSKSNIAHLSSFVKLTAQQLEDSGCGLVNSAKLARKLKEIRTNGITMQRFLASFDIPGIGLQNASAICDKYRPKNIKDLVKIIKGIRNKQPIGEYAYIEALHNIRDDLYSDMVECSNIIPTLKGVDGHELDGIQFAFSGHFDRINRAKAGLIVSWHGGKQGAVTSKTKYLVCNDDASTSSKCRKANQLGVRIINEDEFIKTLLKYGIEYYV